MRNLLIGNGVNIQHGGKRFGNQEIIVRTLRNFAEPTFPEHILGDEPILAKCYMGYLFLEARRILSGEDSEYALSQIERDSLREFGRRYGCRSSLRITDIGFEDYILLHDIFGHRIQTRIREQSVTREAIKGWFLHAIYDDGRVNDIHRSFSDEFTEWMKTFDMLFTTNYDSNIELATKREVLHLHGDFSTRDSLYCPDSFQNQLPGRPHKQCVVDEKYPHLYSTALTTYSGEDKLRSMGVPLNANAGIEKSVAGYTKDESIRKAVDSWRSDPDPVLRSWGESIVLRAENPNLKFTEDYPLAPFKQITGEIAILGLSPYNDHHLFRIMDKSAITRCTYYFHDESQREAVSSLLPNKQVVFEDVLSFWGGKHRSSSRTKSPQRRQKTVCIKKPAFGELSDCYRALSESIMCDNDIVSQFNSVCEDTRAEICLDLSGLKQAKGIEAGQQFILSFIDLHIIATEYGLDPAVVCCIGVDRGRNEMIRLID